MLSEKKGVDKLVFLLVISDQCEVGSDTEVRILLAGVAAPAERKDCAGEADPSKIVVLEEEILCS